MKLNLKERYKVYSKEFDKIKQKQKDKGYIVTQPKYTKEEYEWIEKIYEKNGVGVSKNIAKQQIFPQSEKKARSINRALKEQGVNLYTKEQIKMMSDNELTNKVFNDEYINLDQMIKDYGKELKKNGYSSYQIKLMVGMNFFAAEYD